jgi:hypothetical protein
VPTGARAAAMTLWNCEINCCWLAALAGLLVMFEASRVETSEVSRGNLHRVRLRLELL